MRSSRNRNRTLRRVKQTARNRVIARVEPRTVDTENDDLAQRKRIEKLWELSINFFDDLDRIDSTDRDIKPKGD